MAAVQEPRCHNAAESLPTGRGNDALLERRGVPSEHLDYLEAKGFGVRVAVALLPLRAFRQPKTPQSPSTEGQRSTPAVSTAASYSGTLMASTSAARPWAVTIPVFINAWVKAKSKRMSWAATMSLMWDPGPNRS